MHRKSLESIERCLKNINIFISRNNTLIELFFLILYSLEQVFLIYFTLKQQTHLEYTISLFIVIFLFTFALQKICMEMRIKYLERLLQDTISEKDHIYKESREIHENTISLKKDLNKSESKKKGGKQKDE